MFKITQQDIQSWKSALTPTPSTLLSPYQPSLPRPAAMDGKQKRFVIFTRNFAASRWGFIPRKTDPRQIQQPSGCSAHSPLQVGLALSVYTWSCPLLVLLRPFGLLGMGLWRMPEPGQSLQQLMLMGMVLPEELAGAGREFQQCSAHMWGQFFECPQHCRGGCLFQTL